MGFRINTNVSSIAAQRSLTKTSRQSQDTLAKMSSGTRITKAADDAAGFAISEKLKSQVRSLQQADRNANDGISMVQTAEGGLDEVSSILTRLRELSCSPLLIQLATLKEALADMEYQNLSNEFERISQVTEFNGTNFLTDLAES